MGREREKLDFRMDRIRVVKQPPSLSPPPSPNSSSLTPSRRRAICKLTSYGRRRAGKGRVTRPTVIDQSLPNRGHHQQPSAASRGEWESRLSDPGGTRDLASVHSHIRTRPLLHARLHGLPSCQICQHIHAAARSSASPRMGDGHATYRLHGRAANHSSTLDKRLAGNIQMSFLTSPDITKEFQARTCQLLDTAVREQRMTPESVLDRESRPRPTTTSGLFEAGLGGQGAGISESIHLICWEAKHE